MPRLPLHGLPALGWGRRPATATEGLVLSGGGSRASFQLGALRYLYDHAGIHPTTMVGTSAGSILTAALAQHADRDDQSAALRQVEELWLGMRTSDEMFHPRPWFALLEQRGEQWRDLLAAQYDREPPTHTDQSGRRGEGPDDPGSPVSSGRPVSSALGRARAAAARTGERLGVLSPTEPPEPLDVDEPDELTGQELTLALARANPVAPSRSFSPQMVFGMMGLLPQLRSAPDDLSTILRGIEGSRSMYFPGTLLLHLLDDEVFQSGAVECSGVTVRIAMVALESGELRFMTESGEVVDRDNVPVPDVPVQDFSLGVLASCSIPAVFAPVRIGEEWYVDGGVREATPAEMAIGQLGVDRCYVVVSSPIEQPPASSFDDKSMLSVMLRSSQIISDEAERDEIAYARTAGALVIEPELFVHDATTVQPGLIRINRDYGWMRAAEAHLRLPETIRAVNGRIVTARLRAFELERLVLEGKADEDVLLELARTKLELRDDVAQSDPKHLPPQAHQWWREWERHADPVTMTPPWLSQPA